MKNKSLMTIGGVILLAIVVGAGVFIGMKVMDNNIKEEKEEKLEKGYKYLFCYLDEDKNGVYTHTSQTLYFEKGELRTANIDKSTDIMDEQNIDITALQQMQTECESYDELSIEYPWFMNSCDLDENRQMSMQSLDLSSIKASDIKKPATIGWFTKMYKLDQTVATAQKTLEKKGYTCSTSK